LAKVLVRKARGLAQSAEQLRDALAPSIQEPKARELFLTGDHGHPSSHPPSQPPSGHSQSPSSQSIPVSQPRPRSGSPSMPSRPSGGAWAGGPNSIPASTRGVTQPSSTTLRSQTTRRAALDIPPEELTAIELALSKHIGPMAKMLVKREFNHSPDLKTFVDAIAANIDKADQREVFMETLRRTLHKRSF
jgi:hypothetical protein